MLPSLGWAGATQLGWAPCCCLPGFQVWENLSEQKNRPRRAHPWWKPSLDP